jgi:RNA polymerase sigma-70 factor, ECF subfamily
MTGRGVIAKPGFEATVLPHLDAAYNLGRWLMRERADADDVVQEAVLRAATYFEGFRGVNARARLLQIVRNTAYASKKMANREASRAAPADATGEDPAAQLADLGDDPETALMRRRIAGL